MSRSFTCFDGQSFRLTSWGRGVAFLLVNKREGMELFLQGDDALEFEADMEATTKSKPSLTFQQVAAWLWDQCGYGDAAMPCAVDTAMKVA